MRKEEKTAPNEDGSRLIPERIRRIVECVFNIDVLYRELEDNLATVNYYSIKPEHNLYSAFVRYQYIQVCSILDEIERLNGLAKDDNYLQDTMYVISPIIKAVKSYSGIRPARNYLFAHANRNKKGEFYPWWISLRGLKLPRTFQETNQLFRMVYMINSLLVSRYYEELKTLSLSFKKDEEEYFKWIDQEEKNQNDFHKIFNELGDVVQKRFGEKNFKHIILQHLPFDDFSISAGMLETIILEIESQWEYLVMVRAIFHSKFPEQIEFESPSFYAQYGMKFNVKIPTIRTKAFDRASKGIGVWLNQNYVIRLFGILDSRGVIKYGLAKQSNIIKLISILRNNVGAHSAGSNVSKRGQLISATTLINNLFGRKIDVDEVEHFTLSIDSVLLPMKEQVIDFVRKISKSSS